MTTQDTKVPVTLPEGFDAAAARERVVAINELLSEAAITAVLELMALGQHSPEQMDVMVQKRAFNGPKTRIALRELSADRLAAMGGPGDYTCQVKPSGRGNFSRSWIEQIWQQSPQPGPAAIIQQPAPQPTYAPQAPLFQPSVADAILRRLEAMETRLVQGVGQPAPQRDALSNLKEMAGLIEIVRGFTTPPKAAGLEEEIAKFKLMQSVIAQAASGKAVADDDEPDEGWIGQLVAAVGPALPKFIDALSRRMVGQPTPGIQQAAAQAPQTRPARGTRVDRPSPQVMRETAPRPLRITPDVQVSAPSDPNDDTPTEIRVVDAAAGAHAVIARLCPLMRDQEENGVESLAAMAAAETPVDAAQGLLDMLSDDEEADRIMAGYQPGEMAALLSAHPKLAGFADWLSQLETAIREDLEHEGEEDQDAGESAAPLADAGPVVSPVLGETNPPSPVVDDATEFALDDPNILAMMGQ